VFSEPTAAGADPVAMITTFVNSINHRLFLIGLDGPVNRGPSTLDRAACWRWCGGTNP
jgi:hypothetical protein